MSEWVHPEHRAIDELLRNWARWVIERKHQGHCLSIEHRFKWREHDDTPTGWGDWLTTPPKNPHLAALNEPQALLIEQLMRYLPDTLRRLLKWKYVYRLPQRRICKKLHWAYHRWEEGLYQARQAVFRLTNEMLTPIVRKQFGIADFTSRSGAPSGALFAGEAESTQLTRT